MVYLRKTVVTLSSTRHRNRMKRSCTDRPTVIYKTMFFLWNRRGVVYVFYKVANANKIFQKKQIETNRNKPFSKKEKEKKTTHDLNALILWVGDRVATVLVMSVHTCRPGRLGGKDALQNFSFYFSENKLAHSCT